MGSGKVSNNGAKAMTYYGNVAGIICQGQIDSIWGVMLNNELVYPAAYAWDSKLYHNGVYLLFIVSGTLGCYQAGADNRVDPPNFPWVLRAVAYNNATTYHSGDKVLGADNSLWQSTTTQTGNPPNATKPNPAQMGQTNSGNHNALTNPNPTISNWKYLGSPVGISANNLHAANAIVSYNGRLYTTPSSTNNQPPNSPWVLWKIDRVSSANPLKFTVPKYGDCYLYWGTKTQTLDSTNEAFLTSFGHPAYRGRAVLVLKNFLFGQGTVTPPSMKVLALRNPVQTVITGASATLDADWNANPWCVLAELLTDPIIGLGLPTTMLDATTWQAEADRVALNPQLYYISPMLTSLAKLRDLVQEIMSYPDSFIFWSVLATLAAGHWPHGEAAPAFTNANTISRDQWLKEPDESGQGWGGTFNAVELSYRDLEAAFAQRTLVAPNLFNRQVTQRLLTMRLDRPHIVRADQAMANAIEAAKINGDRQVKGTMDIKDGTASSIAPGSIFLYTDDVAQTSNPMRCTRLVRKAPPSTVKTIEYETERGVAPQPYSPTRGLVPTAPGLAPTRLIFYQLAKISPVFNLGDGLFFLACRQDTNTSHAELWFQQSDGVNLTDIGTVTKFAVGGAMMQSETWDSDTAIGLGISPFSVTPVTQGATYSIGQQYFWSSQVKYGPGGGPATTLATPGTDYVLDADAGTITIVSGGNITTGDQVDVYFSDEMGITLATNIPADDLSAIAITPTDDEIRDGKLLMFLHQASDPSKFEIMSVSQMLPNGGLGVVNYQVFGKRAMFGTLPGGDGSHKWDVGDIVMIIKKDDLASFDNQGFLPLEQTSSAGHFILAPGTSGFNADPTDIYDANTNPTGLSTATDYLFGDPYVPQVTWDSLLVNGGAVNFATTYATTDNFDFSFTIFDASASAIICSLVASSGNIEIPLWSGQVSPGTTAGQSIEVKFAGSVIGTGTWKLILKMTNSDGRTTFQNLQSPAGTDVQILIGTATAAAPVVTSWSVQRTASYSGGVTTFNYIVSAFHINGYADTNVQYQITAKGAQPAGGSWVNATSAGGGLWTVAKGMVASTHTIWFLGIHTGISNSAPVPYNFHF
jgi:hypothetical protein